MANKSRLTQSSIIKTNVTEIISNNKCSGCGICAGICPTGALKMKINANGFYRPIINKDKCNDCGLCLNVCPVHNKAKSINARSNDKIFGSYTNIYGGWLKNEQLRKDASSGGIARGLAFHLLNEKKIDGVWAIAQNNTDLLKPQTILFKKIKDLKKMAKSLYIPTEYSKVTRYLLNNSGRYLIIGLPCQIAGLRKAQKYFKAKVILVELFCGRMVSKLLTEAYIKLFTKEKMPNLLLDYRDKVHGWYNFSISIKNKATKEIIARHEFNKSIFGFLMNGKYFAQNSCLDCEYAYSGVADITLGDFWRKEYSNERQGVSLMVARTNYGDTILKKCKNVLLFQAKISDIYSTQSHLVRSYKYSKNKLLSIIKEKKQIFNKLIIKLYFITKNLKIIYYLCRLDDKIFTLTVKTLNLTKMIAKDCKTLAWKIILGIPNKIIPTNKQYNKATVVSKKKIFITGVPDIGNQGSFAMFKTLIDNIEKIIGKHNYILETDNLESAHKTLTDLNIKNVEIIPNYFLIKNKNKIKIYLEYFWKLLNLRLELNKWKKSSILIKKLSECSVIINIGGDTLSNSPGLFSVIMGLDKLLLGRALGLKTVILAHTLGKYNIEPYKTYILSKMKKIDMITVRENISFNYMSSLNFKKIIKTSDLAFLLKPSDYIAEKLNLQKIGKFACFVPSAMLYKKTFSDLKSLDKRYQAYLEITRHIIDSLLKKGFKVLILPHVYVESYRDDLNAKEIKEKMYPNENNVIYLDTQFYAHEIKEIIKHSKCVVSLRMHPTISAISQNIPSFLITDTHKGEGILGELLPKKFIINCRGFTHNELQTKIKNCLSDFFDFLDNTKSTIDLNKIKKNQIAAEKNFILLEELIKNDKNV